MTESMDSGCLGGPSGRGQHEFRWATSGRGWVYTRDAVKPLESGLYYCIRCLFELTPIEALSWRREVLPGK